MMTGRNGWKQGEQCFFMEPSTDWLKDLISQDDAAENNPSATLLRFPLHGDVPISTSYSSESSRLAFRAF
jgi:hypothetical protein